MRYTAPISLRLTLSPLVLLAVTFVLTLELTAQDKPEPVDTSILEERYSLFSFLSLSQRISFSRAEEQVKDGESKLRRGKFMANREPSKLNPDEDLTETKARGKRLIEAGQTEIRQGQAAMVAILQAAKAERAASAPPEDILYEYPVDSAENYESGLEAAASVVLRACWDTGYNQIFFDRVFESNADGTTRAATSVNNLTYETLIKIDATRFSLNLPTNFQLDLKKPGAGRQFTFDNLDAYSKKRIALLSVEIIEFPSSADEKLESDDAEAPKINQETVATSGSDAAKPEIEATGPGGHATDPPPDESEESRPPIQLLVVQALDLDTLKLVRQELRWIVPENAIAPKSSVEDKMALTEQKQKIQLLASLPEPYQFRIEAKVNDPIRAMMLEAYLAGALMEHFSLKIVPVGALQRTYAASKDASFRKTVNARFSLQPDKTGEARLGLSAIAEKANQSLSLGWAELSEE